MNKGKEIIMEENIFKYHESKIFREVPDKHRRPFELLSKEYRKAKHSGSVVIISQPPRAGKTYDALNNYKRSYNKEHYKTFKVDLKVEEWDEIDTILKQKGITKAQFLRDAIKMIKK